MADDSPDAYFQDHSVANHGRRRNKNFENSKNQCLGKRDKSSAGRIDPYAVEICGLINQKFESYYTTSSCAGRCFLYQGRGVKSSHNLAMIASLDNAAQQQTHFVRFRVSHDLVRDATRYFDLTTLESDPSGGGDPIRTIGQFENKPGVDEKEDAEPGIEASANFRQNDSSAPSTNNDESLSAPNDQSVWLRFEPFILHVACRSLSAAAALMSAARPAFKNVGLTTWTATGDGAKFIVAIWGDEGIDMPLSTPEGVPLFASNQTEWLASLVNERHERNWEKIDRFVEAVRNMPVADADDCEMEQGDNGTDNGSGGVRIPRSFDVVGDVCLLHAIPDADNTEEGIQAIGEAIMKRNKAIKVVALRQSNLVGTERAPGEDGIRIIAGANRVPLMTSHVEYGIKVAVDLNHTFFSPRMGQERLRICQQVARGEHVLVLFCGVGMDAMQIAGRTEASSITAVEYNDVAVQCCIRSKRFLERNKTVKCAGAAERLEIVQGDVLEIMPTLPRQHYDRVLAPRPKEGALDGDLGNGDSGNEFLQAILPAMKPNGGECHWYDFVSTNEFPTCDRTRTFLERVCNEHNLEVEILHVANAGSVAMRQLRVCVDFRIRPKSE